MKFCTICDTQFPMTLEFFYALRGGRGGLGSHCKPCERQRGNIQAQAWYRANKARKHARDKAAYAREGPARRANASAWQKAHPERVAAKNRNWELRHPDKVRAKQGRRVLLLQQKIFSEVHWAEALEYFNNACAYCLRSDRELTRDHLLPLIRGGQHTPENVVPACRSCNSRKRTRTPLEWLMAMRR